MRQILNIMKKFVLFAGLFLMCSTCLLAEKKVTPTAVVFDSPVQNHYVGEEYDIPYTVLPEGADETLLYWESGTGKVATCNLNHMTFHGAGSTIVTVRLISDPTSDLGSYEFSADYVNEGQCGDYLWWSLSVKSDNTLKLEFWPDAVGKATADNPYGSGTYNMYNDYMEDIPGNTVAPWNAYNAQISEIARLDNVEFIGKYAFTGMPLLSYVTLYKQNSLGDYVFWGDTNLKTLDIYSITVLPKTSSSLELSFDGSAYINTIIVPDEETRKAYHDDTEYGWWPSSDYVITAKDGEWNKTHWEVGQSDSLKTLRLQIGSSWVSTEEDSYVIPDMDDPSESPWAQLGDNVQDLVIGEKISYIGRNAFASLTNLQTIQFHQWDVPLESIHIEAFDKSITPWKFAMGDPQDGPILPPKIVGLTEENKDLLELFATQTVLYVPDSTFILDGKEVSSIELYKNDPFWGKFNRVTDRTVALEDVQDVSVEMSWLPLEHAEAYLLTISKKDCMDCDTTIEIKALGGKGLIDWEHNEIPEYLAAKRAPKSDDGQGGMTVTIKIKVGGGTAPNTDVKVEASGLKADSEYEYKREVIVTGGVKNPGLGKAGEFTTKAKETPQSIGQNESETNSVLCTKILRGGQIYLQLPDGQVFNSLGIRIR